ncbi:site-specific integrase [Pararhizobium sp. A13]|uniref:site-specific integrase n=1 Tax=Pararhizobium sp. A13 TaxID=3133975 RepID=UPI0032465BCB
MAGTEKHLLNRDGRYFARIVIPKALRPFLDNKTELRDALGPDRRLAQARLHSAVAGPRGLIAVAERKAQIANGTPIEPGRYSLPVDQIALRNYNVRLTLDSELRNNFRCASVGIDDQMVASLREGLAGKLDDHSLERLVGRRIEHYRLLGNTTAEKGTDEWRILARALCISELEALGRAMERDEGDYAGKPEHPMLAVAVVNDDNIAADPAEFNQLAFEDIIVEQERITSMGLGGKEKAPRTLEKYRRIVAELDKFRRKKRVATIKLHDAEGWRDTLLASGKQSRKTVLDKLAAIRAVVTWGQKQSRGKLFPKGMPLEYLELPVKEARDSASRTYTLDQARAVLKAARGEARQLEKGDFFQIEDRWFLHIRVVELH